MYSHTSPKCERIIRSNVKRYPGNTKKVNGGAHHHKKAAQQPKQKKKEE